MCAMPSITTPMETKHTDKKILFSGLKKMAVSLLCMFIGPTLVYMSPGMANDLTKNAALILGILICIGAVYYGFMGIRTILKSIF